MKTNFTKIGFTCLIAGMAFSTASAEKIANAGFSGFVKHVECREVENAPIERALPKNPTEILQKTAQRTPARFVGWNAEDPSMPNLVAKSSADGEQMDSVVGTNLNGDLVSMQKFRFTDNGLPLECSNFLPSSDGDSWTYVGHYEYEYDSQDRLISAENINLSSIGSCQRMEYIYGGDSRAYNCQIAYLMNEDGDWYPFQKGEYAFDANGNTIEEIYFSWDNDKNDWNPIQKTTASYDEMNRMTSYFPYIWDTENDLWVGITAAGASRGQRFEYTQAGKDALIAEFEWRDGKWIEYFRTVFTYNDSALLVKKERLYWNREAQDWSGDETWGQWESTYYNEYETYVYDEYGRSIELNMFTSKSGDYVNYFRQTSTYTSLEDNVTEKVELKGSVTADGVFAPYAKTIQHFNGFNLETYYISYKDNAGEWVPQQEEFRYYMDDYKWFLGADYYSYMNGQRKPSSKEWFTYPEDFNPELGYETPIEGRHWIGIGIGDEAEWKLKHVDCFTWGPRDVMIGYVNYDYLQSQGCRTAGWDIEYDFSADTSNIFLWPDVNMGAAYYENKTLSSNTYNNYDYWNGNDEWMPEFSYNYTYYYSPRTSAGIVASELPEGVTETERYDLMGHKLAAPTMGINIVRYSDGSSRKVMVK